VVSVSSEVGMWRAWTDVEARADITGGSVGWVLNLDRDLAWRWTEAR
jgi:hypothetical protein